MATTPLTSPELIPLTETDVGQSPPVQQFTVPTTNPYAISADDDTTGRIVSNTPEAVEFLNPNPYDLTDEDLTPSRATFSTAEVDPAADPVTASQNAAREASRFTNRAIQATSKTTEPIATFIPKQDWRVRLSLAPGSNYLYNAPGDAGILAPLKATDGVIFPYTPSVQVQYSAHYDPATLTHSNYKIHQYSSSSVDSVTISCDFTAQDTAEANYMLAVIHFFKSVTKMFYGQDKTVRPGTPPPLCYLTGLGQFQFDAHPLAITSFNYQLPVDVDYVRAGVGQTSTKAMAAGLSDSSRERLAAVGLQPNGAANPPRFNFSVGTNTQATYVPSKLQLTITAIPMVTRNDISNKFSLEEYATGKLLRGSQRGGGIW